MYTDTPFSYLAFQILGGQVRPRGKGALQEYNKGFHSLKTITISGFHWNSLMYIGKEQKKDSNYSCFKEPRNPIQPKSPTAPTYVSKV